MTASSPCPQPQELHAFAQGNASLSTVQALILHLAHCDSCLHYIRCLSADGPMTAAHVPEANGSVFHPPAAPTLTPISYSFLRAPMAPDEIGRLGNYRVQRLLGRGGMAFVFQAEDITLRRPVALKVMRPELGDDLDPWQRFVREARMMAAIKHDHLVTVYQASQEGDVFFLAMELLEGTALENRIYQSPRPDAALILRIGREIAIGLSAIHQQGLIHRDLKPGNIWLEAPDEHVKILDFGLARPLNDDTHLTQAGMIVGTPAYMSPEQARNDPLDVRSDLFSLGTVLYCLCTQERPFRGGSTLAELTSLAVDQPPPVCQLNPAIPQPLSDLVMQLLQKDRTQRPASAEEVAERLLQMSASANGSRTAERLRERAVPASVASPTLSKPSQIHASSAERPTEPIRSRRKLVVPAAALAGVLLIGGFLGLWLGSGTGGNPSAPGNRAAGSPLEEERVYLDQLKMVRSSHFPFDPPDRPPPKEPPDKEPPDKGPPDKWPPPSPFEGGIRVNGTPYRHGFGMHPHPDGCSVTYALDGKYEELVGRVSLNDSSARSPVGLIFSVWDGEKELRSSQPVRTRADTQELRVPVKGVKELTLKIDFVGRGEPRGAHGAWLDPYVTKRR